MAADEERLAPRHRMGLHQGTQRRLTGEKPPDLGTILFASGDWLVYAFLTPAVFAIAGRWPVARPHAVRHSFLHLAMSLGFCVAWATMGALLRTLVMPEGLFGGGFFMHLVFWTFITLPFGVPVYLSVVGVEHAIRYFVEARDRQVQLARLSEQLSTARFAALQAQLNPHFLFNTLNTVTVLVRQYVAIEQGAILGSPPRHIRDRRLHPGSHRAEFRDPASR